MSRSEEDVEQFVAAICYRLGIKEQSDQLYEIWSDLKHSNDYQQQARKISQDLARRCERAFAYLLGLHDSKTSEDGDTIAKLWRSCLEVILGRKEYLSTEEKENIERIVSSAIHDVLKSKSVELPPVENKKTTQSINQVITPAQIIANNELTEKEKSQSSRPNSPKPPSAPIPPLQVQSQPQKDAIPASTTSSYLVKSVPYNSNISPPSNPDNKQSSSERIPSPAAARWSYLPIPDELDKHDEFYCKSDKSPEGMKLIGARVRGKGHKHQGTNCDDWFEFAVIGKWTIIAVSDGAGSKKFSRLGAKISCEAAVKYLEQKLKDVIIEERDTKQHFSAAIHRDTSWVFSGKDIESVQKVLHEAMQDAYKVVEQVATERGKLAAYYKILNKDLEVSDLSATLLLAVHTTVKAEGANYSLVLTCQVGDGMLAAVSCEGSLQLLAKPDSGHYSGQTEFLTSKNKLQKANLLQKTFVFPGHLKALMVMTDGVADDYFPNDPKILELYGDLVLNHVIKIAKPNETDITENLRKTRLGSTGGVKEAKHKFQLEVERITDPTKKDEPNLVCISSVADYAKELGKSVPEVVASSALLAGGILDEQMCNKCHNMKPEEKLQLWLDSYYKKGSFDDRTLVVLYREEG